MADHQQSRPAAPTVLCRLCGEGIWTVEELVLAGLGAAHATCLERSADDDLTDVERSRLIRNCSDHPVAACEACHREYRITEMGNDMLGGRYYFCPFCRVDLVWSVRKHIVECAVISQNDPRWQAEVREALAHAREVRKVSSQLRDTSELARVTSEELQRRARITAVAARRAAEESERIKRERPGGK